MQWKSGLRGGHGNPKGQLARHKSTKKLLSTYDKRECIVHKSSFKTFNFPATRTGFWLGGTANSPAATEPVVRPSVIHRVTMNEEDHKRDSSPTTANVEEGVNFWMKQKIPKLCVIYAIVV